MAVELHIAALYDFTPAFTRDKNNEVVGKYAIDASMFTSEIGWDMESFKREALKIVYLNVCKTPIPKMDEFYIARLNSILKLRQINKTELHRFEMNCCDETLTDNPLSNPDYCQALSAEDYLSNLPIVHFAGMVTINKAKEEAVLSSIIDELFIALNKYGYTP